MLRSIEKDVRKLLKSSPGIFTFHKANDGMADIRDFQTMGVVAFARGCPFHRLDTGRLDVGGHRVRVNESMKVLCVDAVQDFVAEL